MVLKLQVAAMLSEFKGAVGLTCLFIVTMNVYRSDFFPASRIVSGAFEKEIENGLSSEEISYEPACEPAEIAQLNTASDPDGLLLWVAYG